MLSFNLIPERIAYLTQLEISGEAHTGSTLLSHLIGTYELLASWDQNQAVGDAGLFHSVYGTLRYRKVSLPKTRRKELQEIIGVYAEQLVFIFSVMRAQSFIQTLALNHEPHRVSCFGLSDFVLRGTMSTDLCHLLVANWLEQRERRSSTRRSLFKNELRKIHPFLTSKAQSDLISAYPGLMTRS